MTPRNPQAPEPSGFSAKPGLRRALTFLIMLGLWVVFAGPSSFSAPTAS